MEIDEDHLVQQLYYVCDKEGKEPDQVLKESSEILYKLGLVYKQKSPDKIGK